MWFRRKKGTLFEAAGLSDIGMVRTNNEDNIFVLDKNESSEQGAKSRGIYIISDGMGGHASGEVASEMATRIISETLTEKLTSESNPESESGPLSPSQLVQEAIVKANQEIFKTAGSRPELHNMGTTVTLGLRLDNSLYLGHVGDSRAYLCRKGKLRQLTEDHSLIAKLLKEKIITQEEAKTHPDRGKILRCLGVSEDVEVDPYNQDGKEHKLVLQPEDSLLFCSDGLTGYASDREILNCMKEKDSADLICRNLISLANSNGGGDNVSVIVVKVKSEKQ